MAQALQQPPSHCVPMKRLLSLVPQRPSIQLRQTYSNLLRAQSFRRLSLPEQTTPFRDRTSTTETCRPRRTSFMPTSSLAANLSRPGHTLTPSHGLAETMVVQTVRKNIRICQAYTDMNFYPSQVLPLVTQLGTDLLSFQMLMTLDSSSHRSASNTSYYPQKNLRRIHISPFHVWGPSPHM